MSPGKSGIKVTASDALEFEPVAVVKPKGRRWLMPSSLLVVLCGAGAGWYIYGERLTQLIGGKALPIPVVRAVAGPVKVRPDDPGGKQIPNQDVLVYGRFQGDDGTTKETKVERLLPPPETPMPKPRSNSLKTEPKPSTATEAAIPPPRLTLRAKSKETAKVPTEDDVAAIELPPTPSPPAAPAAAAPAKETAVIPEQSPAIPAKLVETAAQAAMKTSPSVPKATTKSAKSVMQPAQAETSLARTAARSVYRAQLAAARSADAAEREWVRLRAKNLDLLGNLELTITKADLGAKKGVFYRLQVGPLSDEKKVRELCSALAKRQVGCLIIKPDG